MSLSVTIIDYDAGNLRNVQKALEYLGYEPVISRWVGDVECADVLILPGVGAFRDGMDSLEKLDLHQALRREVIDQKKPVLGICLGMQLMAEEGYEGGKRAGLALLSMTIQRLSSDDYGLRIPHIGWNDVVASDDSVLFNEIPVNADFYFVHGYHAVCKDETIVTATSEYGHKFVSAVENNHIFGTQFHPEKSQKYGLQVLQNFMSHCEKLKLREN